MKSKKKEKLLESALFLFSRNGFHANGIDAILLKARVAKSTLYKHFPSKEALIIATLERQDERFRNWLVRSVEEAKVSAEEKLYLLFDLYKVWEQTHNFNGSIFNKASMEYAELDSPIHAVAAMHKKEMLRYVKQLVVDVVGSADADSLSTQIMLLLDGATAAGQIFKSSAAFDEAKVATQKLIETSMPNTAFYAKAS